MNHRMPKRIVALLMTITLCVLLCACQKGGEPRTTLDKAATQETNTKETENGQQSAPGADEIADPNQEELLEKIRSWAAWGEQGVLKQKNSCQLIKIDSARDLAPYREYFENLSADEEKMFLEDKGGYCVLVEITSASPHTYYDCNSVFRDFDRIEILIHERMSEPEGDEMILPIHPEYTFFLFYLPDEIYSGETVHPVFIAD